MKSLTQLFVLLSFITLYDVFNDILNEPIDVTKIVFVHRGKLQ